MKKVSLFIASVVLSITALQARIVPVVSPADFPAAFTASLDGDTLQVYSGTYATSIAIPAGKAVTIWAADTTKAIFTNTLTTTAGTKVDGGSLSFENITVNGTSYYVNLNGYGNIKLLSWKNCEIKNINRCFLYGNCPDSSVLKSAVEKLVIKNSTIHDCNVGNWNMMWTKTPVLELTMEQNTFYNNGGVESWYLPRSTFTGMSFLFNFNNNTVFQGSRDATRYICNAGSSYTGEESVVNFNNNIIVAPTGKVAGGLLNMGIGQLFAKNNLVATYGAYKLTTPIAIDTANQYSLATFGMATPEEIFLDPANANFSIYDISPLAKASTTGGIIGASKWFKVAGTLYNLTREMAAGVDPLAGTIGGPKGKIQKGDTVTVTATKNYGFKFVKWVDAAGTTVSSEPTYKFAMNSDVSIYAVFEAITLYKLNLTIEGGGQVTISEPGKDGKYEYYEVGKTITLTAVSNPVIEFVFWGDFDGSPTKNITFGSNQDVIATFASKRYVCGFEFNTVRNNAAQNRRADFIGQDVDTSDVPALSMYSSLDPTTPYSTWWNRTQGPRYAATAWKTYATEGSGQVYFWQTRISTLKYKDVSVRFALLSMYYGYNKYKLTYSFNNLSYETAGTHVVNSGWTDYCDTIPNSAGKENLWIRITPDGDPANMHGSFKDVDGTHIADIYILEAAPTAVKEAYVLKPEALVQNGVLSVTKLRGVAQARLIGLDGRIVKSEQVNGNFNWSMPALKGMYILQVGDFNKKVIF